MMNDGSTSGAETTPVRGRRDIDAPSTAASIRFDDARMATSYANAASVAFSSDEIHLLCGMNKGLMVLGAGFEVTLASRGIIAPTVVRGLVETPTRLRDTSRR